jgi:preprotein translocase subunit SecF
MDFVGKRKIFYTLSLILLLLSVISFFVQGLNYGIDFMGGTLLQVEFEKAGVTNEDVRTTLEEFGLEKSSLQQSEDSFIIKALELDKEKRGEVLKSLEDNHGKFELLRNENVGPVVGDELKRVGIIALVIAFVLQIIYISFRFEFRFGIAGIMALFHDAIITIGFFSLFQYEVDLTFVAALLSIVGFSINDTIVIFDRIRENLKTTRKVDLAELVNNSIKQNLVRTFNTSFTVAVMLFALLLFGGETTYNFALAMLVGVICGVYTTVFLASSLWYDFVPLVNGQKKIVKL